MTTIHLTDAQLAQFTATGLIVVDGEPITHLCSHPLVNGQCSVRPSVAPELWRKLTVECDGSDTCLAGVHIIGCYRSTLADEANEFVGMLPVVTLTATCPWCDGLDQDRVFKRLFPDADPNTCDCPSHELSKDPEGLGVISCDAGVVTVGRFTIRLLPVTRSHDQTPPPFLECEPDEEWQWLNLGDGVVHPLTLDPVPQPGQWAVVPEAVP